MFEGKFSNIEISSLCDTQDFWNSMLNYITWLLFGSSWKENWIQQSKKKKKMTMNNENINHYFLKKKTNLITTIYVKEFQCLCTFYVILWILGWKGGGGAQGGSHCNSQKCSIPCDMDGTGERRRRNESPLRNIKWTQNDIGRRKRRKRKII